MAKTGKTGKKRGEDWLARMGILTALRVPQLLPYRMRGPVVAWLMAYVFAPLAGYRSRIRDNLAYAWPDLPDREVQRLTRRVPANVGRMLIESLAGQRFARELGAAEITGPGAPALAEARAAGRPVVAVSGHFGNFDAPRCALVRAGHQVGALYRPNDDPVLDAYYHGMLAGIAEPVFPRGRNGLGRMVRFLRAGNTVAILTDQYVHGGAPLTFFGRIAPTSLAAAEMALKYKAILVPMYGIRRRDGFEIVAEAPIPHTDPTTMMQAVNDSLEARVRAHPDQWLWIHRRWKPERQRVGTRAAARTSPGPSA